jgi:isopenicillin-N N-acyltransferase-like protein
MILNNHTDLRDFSFAQNDPQLNESLNECSAFALKTSQGIIAGQTWDMHGSASPYVAHLTIHKKIGDKEVTQEIFTLTGCLALTGINSQGLGVFINNLRSNEMSIGLAWPALIRKILDQSTLQAAQECIQNNLPSGGRSFLLSDNASAMGFEVTGKQIKSFGKDTFVAHTNHYLTDLKKTEDLESRSKSTFDRLEKISSLLEESLKLEIKNEKDLADHLFLQDTSNILCIPVSSQSPHASATCGGMIYDFALKKGFSFGGLYKSKVIFTF